MSSKPETVVKPAEVKANTKPQLENKKPNRQVYSGPNAGTVGCLGEFCAIQGGKRKTNRKVKKSRKQIKTKRRN